MKSIKNRAVLVVEDDREYGLMLADALKQFGMHVIVNFTAQEALDTIRQEKFDIILSDLNMPGMSGLELSARIREMFLGIPFVLITGISDLSQVQKALDGGVSDYIVKPVKLQDLPVVIERNLRRRQRENRLLQQNKAEILLKALNSLMRALDAKDSYTYGHSQRVVKLAMLMADEMKFSDDQRYTLQISAALHDIGKIGMPDSILKKADSLEDFEVRRAKHHPVVGSEILNEIEELGEVASIVRHHHERFDGSGYPDRLRGEAIPLYARILSILDAYEALISDRVYRKGMEPQQALQEIRKSAGSQFDPGLVSIFITVLEKRLPKGQSGGNENGGQLQNAC
ncbi:MAG: HD domain-containing phosphohydrolase [Calditrichia bacterium]